MKKQWIIGIVACVIVVLAVWLLWPKNQASHARVIPADATALLEFDVNEFVQESDLTEDKLKKMLPEGVDLSASGIDLKKNAYVFVDASGMNGLLLAVDDVDLLKEFLAKNSERMQFAPVEEQQGYNWTSIGDALVVGFDSEVLLVMGPTIASAQAELRQHMLGYLKQDKNESILKAPMYKTLEKQEGLLKAVASLEMFPEYYKMLQNMGLPEHVDFSKMQMFMSLISEKGKIVLQSGVQTDDNTLAQKMKAIDDMIRPIEGDFVSSVVPNALFWLGANVEGEKLMKMMSEIPALRLYLMAMNNVMDVEKMIKQIDGDISMSAAVNMKEAPVLQMQMHMDNLSFMDDVDYWISSAKQSGNYQFERIDEDLYRIGNLAPMDIYFGLKDKNVLLSSNRAAMDRMQKGEEDDLLDPYVSDIKDSKFYAWSNMSTFLMMLQAELGTTGNPYQAQFEKVLGKFDAVALRSKNATSIDLIFYLKEKKSGLKQLFE